MLQAFPTLGQEHQGPVRYNPRLNGHKKTTTTAMRTTALGLPFFEDFTDDSVYPNSSRWVEDQVYINNTMCVSPISRGVATFDALNPQGLPWNPYSGGAFIYCDSLTSQPIDLSAHVPGDSIYLSFFYQPQGYGFYPEVGDSLILYMKIRYGDWLPVWQVPGTTLQPFQQVMIPVTDSLYFHSTFQFRFVNIAALNNSDAVWNVDYIKLDAGRNMYDTTISDVAFSTDPSFYLNDYTSMPYRQFLANVTGERASTFFDSVHNDYQNPQGINYGYYATASDGTVLQTPTTSGTTTLPDTSIQQLTSGVYTTLAPAPASLYQPMVFNNTFYISPTVGSSTGTVPNDSVTRQQAFDNYLSYDDGTCEQAYYLTLYATLPGEISIEHHLNKPDTMQGMAIYFARQDPYPATKTFFIRVYSSLAGVNGAVTNNLLYEQQDCNPGYIDTMNHFWVYKFDTAVALPVGTFYAGIFLPAYGGDDSLYFGLDMNRVGGNHAYYNVLSSWNSSLVQGAIMMRPLLGQAVTSSSVKNVAHSEALTWQISPDPAVDNITFDFPGDQKATWFIRDIQGKLVLSGSVTSGSKVDITGLLPGMYIANISCNGIAAIPQKFIKL